MTYITHGTLNAEKSNAILSIHGLRGNRNTQSVWAGPGRALDTDRYFVIQPDTLRACESFHSLRCADSLAVACGVGSSW